MNNETEQILGQIPMERLASLLGTDEGSAREAAEAALPTLLAGVTRQAQDPGRRQGLARAVREDHDAATLAADDPFDRVDPNDGDKIVGHLFGDDRGQVEGQLQAAVGGSGGGLAQKVMPMLAPLVMSWLAGKLTGGGGGATAAAAPSGGGGLGDLLGGVLGGADDDSGAGGGLGDLLGGVLGGGSPGGSGGGGLGDLLGQLGGGAGKGGGLDDLLGSILGGNQNR